MHRQLVQGFFRNARHMLRPNGQIHVSHKIGGPFCKWNLEELALKSSLVLKDSADFRIEDYPGYNNKRGDGSRCDQPFPLGKSVTYMFYNRGVRRKKNASKLTSDLVPKLSLPGRTHVYRPSLLAGHVCQLADGYTQMDHMHSRGGRVAYSTPALGLIHAPFEAHQVHFNNNIYAQENIQDRLYAPPYTGLSCAPPVSLFEPEILSRGLDPPPNIGKGINSLPTSKFTNYMNLCNWRREPALSYFEEEYLKSLRYKNEEILGRLSHGCLMPRLHQLQDHNIPGLDLFPRMPHVQPVEAAHNMVRVRGL